jgi:hypothetical protein
MHRRLGDYVEHLDPPDKVKAHLIRGAMYDAAGEVDGGETEWRSAVLLYRESVPEHAQVALACEAVGWFGPPQNPGRMERLILSRSVRVIAPVADGGSAPEDIRRRATQALAVAAKAGVRPEER